MKVLSLLRTTLLVAAVLGLCAVDAKKPKVCGADGHEPAAVTTAPTTTTTTPTTPAPAKKESLAVPVTVTPAPAANTTTPAPAAADADDDGAPGTVVPTEPSASTTAPTAAPVTSSPSGSAATSGGTVKASFAYTGSNTGGAGSYNMVTSVDQCVKTPHAMSNPISPLDDDLTFVFRGPMTIHNIAVYDGSSGAWTQVSSFAKGGATTNMVFMNNRNIDYSGASSPQGFATADGRGKASGVTAFSGELAAATSPNGNSIYADEKTGAEVNILQNKKCGDVECKGYYDKDGTAFVGWGGGKKILVTKVQMPMGGAPNLPAIWALNGQIVRSGQYGCNCRGMGKGGGCGELDIAEILEKDTSKVSTHYYYYETGTGHDTWTSRPTDAPTTYVTVIDESYGVKVLEISGDFDFSASSISNDVVSKWLA